MIIKNLIIKKLFWRSTYFTIAIHRKCSDKDSLIYTHRFASEIELKSKYDYWVADPMLVEDDNRTFLFYEACHNGKGIIEVIEIYSDGTISTPVVVLEREYHLSYPFVFKDNGEWYMIPESCACNQVQLYKAKVFPFEWELERIILENNAVDTTLLKITEGYLITTSIINGLDESVNQKVYILNSLYDVPRPMEAIGMSPFTSRAAGKFIVIDDKLYRPVQINKQYSYGDGIAFKTISIGDEQYEEKLSFKIFSNAVTFRTSLIDGLHTYTSTDKYEAIDVRCGYYDWLKPMKKLIKLFAQ